MPLAPKNMLYLAQVQKQPSGQLGLQLLVRQEAEHNWILIVEESAIPDIETIFGKERSILV